MTVRAVPSQNQKLLICFRGKSCPWDASIPISKRLRDEMKDYDPRNLYAWDPKAYMNQPQFRVLYRHFDETSVDALTGYRMLQADGYKVMMKPHIRDEFKDDNIKLVVSPAECTDANTSVIDCDIGETLKKKIDAQIEAACEADSTLEDRIESEGIVFFFN